MEGNVITKPMTKRKYWISWWWNADLYYCKIPNKSVFQNLLVRMEKFMTAESDAWFREITFLEREPEIGEYLPRKKLEVFLDNMGYFQAEQNEHTSIQSMEDILNKFMEDFKSI